MHHALHQAPCHTIQQSQWYAAIIIKAMLSNMQGQQQTVLFCGDGLNDLAALGTAEVGMAIGPIDAMAAAPVSTKRSSIAGHTSISPQVLFMIADDSTLCCLCICK